MGPSFTDLLLTLYLVLQLTILVQCYGTGAPADFCQYETLRERNVILRPGHSGPPLNGRRPYSYRIYVGPEMLVGGQTVRRVTLRADVNDYFRGFFIQATRANYSLDEPDRPAYGTFLPVDGTSQNRSCRAAVGNVGGITHVDRSMKTEVSVDWLPPDGCNLGTVQFVATVVRTYSEFWVDIRSDPVEPSGFGRRSLLCDLYVDPYNPVLQNRVLAALRQLEQRRRMAQRQNRRRGFNGGPRQPRQGRFGRQG